MWDRSLVAGFVAGGLFSGATCAEVIVDFEEAEVGMLVEVWEEEGVTFALTSPGLMSFQPHPSGNVGLFEAISDRDIPIQADLPVAATTVSVVFFNTLEDFPTLQAFDGEGALVDVSSAPGLSDPFAFMELSVESTEIAFVRITGVGSPGGVLLVDELRFTPIPAPAAITAVVAALLAPNRRRSRTHNRAYRPSPSGSAPR